MKCPACGHRVVGFIPFLKGGIPASATCARCYARLERPRRFFLIRRLGFLFYVLVLTAGVAVFWAWLMPQPNAGHYALNAALSTLVAGAAFFVACVSGSLVVWARAAYRLHGAAAERFWRSLGALLVRFAAGVLLLCGAAYGLLVVYHRYDDAELEPGAKVWLEESASRARTIPDADNAFFALLGLTASAGKDPHQVGREMFACVENEGDACSKERLKALRGGDALGFAGRLPESLGYAPLNLESLAPHADALQALSADNSVLLERYESLLAYAGYADAFAPQSLGFEEGFLQTKDALRSLHALHVWGLSKLAQTGDDAALRAAIAALARECRLARNMLAGGTYMWITLYAMNVYRDALDILGALLATERGRRVAGADAALLAQLKACVSPWRLDERSLRFFKRRFVGYVSRFDTLLAAPYGAFRESYPFSTLDYALRPLTMYNEMLNLRFRECDLLSRAGTTPESERGGLYKTYDGVYEHLKRLRDAGWSSLRNPFGRREIGVVINRWNIEALVEYFDNQARRQGRSQRSSITSKQRERARFQGKGIDFPLFFPFPDPGG